MNQATSSFSCFYGLPNPGAQAYFAAKQYLTAGKNLVYVTAHEPEEFVQAMQEFAPPHTQTLLFTEYPPAQWAVLHHLLTNPTTYVLATDYKLLTTPLPTPQYFQAHCKTLRNAEVVSRTTLQQWLEEQGYTRQDYTENAGQYALRGSVVDIFSPQYAAPLRFYFAGNRIESIRSFDLDTQNTLSPQDSAVILPLCFEQTSATLADYTPQAQWLLDTPPNDLDFSFPQTSAVLSAFPVATGTECHFQTPLAFQGNFSLLDQQVASLQKQGFKLLITCLNRGELDRLSEIMQDYPHLKEVALHISCLTCGFYQTTDKIAYITTAEIFNRRYQPTSFKHFTLANAQKIRFQDLHPGDYVVHEQHGIGKYIGLEIMDKENNPTDCLILQYRGGSKLYVPMYDFKRIQKYISAGGKKPALSALGGSAWKDIKKRVKEQAQKTAQEILKLEAQRQAAGAPALYGDERMEKEFADSFPFSLTQGQAQAIEDILQDMARPRSMDRVLVGDVGFGKTEVAMRAALRAVMSGKQVLFLVPTTILAAQHYKTFTKRMAGFPVNIALLCRFQTNKEQKEIIRQVKDGTCDILIGTHRLLSKDISLADLGLVIIDEEHRFGVKQKEKIKNKCAGVHTLMLSATPIPRTLNQSLSSLRDISLIETAPRGRTPIKTVVTAWNNELAIEAITQELARGGQVYYVYNSVQSMQSRYLFLKHALPTARICMAHGQMKENQLEKTLWDFNNGKYDILLASTIIESGLDITNANTLIVENAHHFGLAQLYQLRGRIGRADKKAYCYLFHPDWLFKTTPQPEDTYAQLAAAHYKFTTEKDPTEEAKKRLTALMEFSELGSGFKLALRDMEIRGAGQLLGIKQHGYANEVGLSLYCELIANEVKKLKGQPVHKEIRTAINLPLEAYIPPDYLPDEAERLKTYKALMSADEARAKQILQHLADIAGPIPVQLTQLNYILQLSRRAGALQLYQIDYSPSYLELLFVRDFQMPADFPVQLAQRYGTNFQFIKTRHGDGLRLHLNDTQDPATATEQVIDFFEHILKPKML